MKRLLRSAKTPTLEHTSPQTSPQSCQSLWMSDSKVRPTRKSMHRTGHMRASVHSSSLARRWDRGFGHWTTRQNIQFNWIRLVDAPDILESLAEVDMHALQTSGNCIRNVTADPLAGAAADEIEDPRVWAEIIRQWSTLHPEFSFLPRKFKIAVTGAREDRAAVAFHDIGLRIVAGAAGAGAGSAATASRQANARGSSDASRSLSESTPVRRTTSARHCAQDPTHAAGASRSWLRRPRPPRRRGSWHCIAWVTVSGSSAASVP